MSTADTGHLLHVRTPVEVRLPGARELRAQEAKAGRETGPGFLFFGGSRRSGTTWVAGMLNAHPEIECRNEAWLFNDLGCSFPTWVDERKVRAWAERKEAAGTWLRDLGVDEALLLMRRAMLTALYRAAVEREAYKDWARLKWVGDKTTTHLCDHAPDVHAIFPDARFLHMVRDGRDVAVSDCFLLMREREYRGMSSRAVAEIERAREYYYEGRGRPVPLFGPALLEWLARAWVAAIAGGQRACDAFGAHGFMEVRYERLVEDPTRIGEVLAWLGVARDEETVKRLVRLGAFERHSGGRKRGEEDIRAEWRKGVVGDWRRYFTEDDKAIYASLAGELLGELGYSW